MKKSTKISMPVNALTATAGILNIVNPLAPTGVGVGITNFAALSTINCLSKENWISFGLKTKLTKLVVLSNMIPVVMGITQIIEGSSVTSGLGQIAFGLSGAVACLGNLGVLDDKQINK
jgi:hypothetical protein